MATVERAQVLVGKVIRRRSTRTVALVVKVCTQYEKYGMGDDRAVMDVEVRSPSGEVYSYNWWATPSLYDIYGEDNRVR